MCFELTLALSELVGVAETARARVEEGAQSAWQSGSNETTNRLLRHYFPHGTDLASRSQAHLNSEARQLVNSTNGYVKRWTSKPQPSDLRMCCCAATR